MAASRENCKKAVDLLLEHKELQLDVKDHEGMTAADFTQDVDIDEKIRHQADVNFSKIKEEVSQKHVESSEHLDEPESNNKTVSSDKELG